MKEFTLTTISQDEPIIDINGEIHQLLDYYGDNHLYVIYALYVQDVYICNEYDTLGNLTLVLGYRHPSDDDPKVELTSDILNLEAFGSDRKHEFLYTNKDLDKISGIILGHNRIQVNILYSANTEKSIY